MKSRVKKSILVIAIGILINVALAAIKMYVGLSSNSLCIMLDSINSFLDVITCIVTLVVFFVLLAPKQESAPHGYGRGEYLAGFIVAVVSVAMGGLFLFRSINRLAMPEPVFYGWQNMVLISVCVPIKLGMGLMYYFSNKKFRSQALRAVMLDSFLDLGITATSVVAFSVTSRINYAADAIVGIVISVVVIVFGIKMVVENVRAIVVGDGAKEEIAAIETTCRNFGATLEKTDIHDYGYGAKVGNAYVLSPCEADFDKMSAEVRAATNAEITFIAVQSQSASEDEKNQNNASAGDADSTTSNDCKTDDSGEKSFQNADK